jgi:hypothetical protein
MRCRPGSQSGIERLLDTSVRYNDTADTCWREHTALTHEGKNDPAPVGRAGLYASSRPAAYRPTELVCAAAGWMRRERCTCRSPRREKAGSAPSRAIVVARAGRIQEASTAKAGWAYNPGIRESKTEIPVETDRFSAEPRSTAPAVRGEWLPPRRACRWGRRGDIPSGPGSRL